MSDPTKPPGANRGKVYRNWKPAESDGFLYEISRAAERLHLTPEIFTEKLAAHNLGPADFARLCNVTPQAVRMWLGGKSPMPGWIAAIFEIAEK